MTEIDASDASWVRTLSGRPFEFGPYAPHDAYRPQGIAATGDRVWVIDPVGGSDGRGALTEISARTGRLIRVLSGARYHFFEPDAVAAARSGIWVANFAPKHAPGWITELRSFT